MKNTFLAVLFLACAGISNAQNIIPCYTDQMVEKKIAENPAMAADFERARQEILSAKGSETNLRGNAPRIIPVVFHVIHVGGTENISREQILDQIRVLNEDYSRTNADTALTRDIFKPVAANCNIEFRLAQKDPDGNCTDGIVRVYSTLTTSAGESVKALSYWPSTKYLNVWVVRSIASDGSGGTILGYAQFPGFGGAETDGVVVRHDVVGTIGSVNPGISNKGRTLTHEVGHWLGLSHTFQGGCTGGFFGESVEDTPPTANANYGCDTTKNTCTNDNPDLPDMIENYMDYSDGECQNMFTLGQLELMDGVLDGLRSNLISSGNLSSTGTDDTTTVNCKPVANFYSNRLIICAGEDVNFYDDSYNGTIDSHSWTFDGGTPGTSTNADPTVQFDQTGYHQVSLTVENSEGNDTRTITQYIYVMPDEATETSWQYYEGFEGSNPNFEDWFVDDVDNIGNQWEQANVGYTGDKSMKLNNHSGNPDGAKDNLILPPIDMTQISEPTLSFKVAHAIRPGGTFSSDSEDALKVYVSFNCGSSWQLRYTRTGDNLATANPTSSAFTPSSQSQWREETINMNSYSTRDHLLIRFEGTSNAGNNIYLDDINIANPNSIEEVDNASNIALLPNPATDHVSLSYSITEQQKVTINVLDITGRIVKRVVDREFSTGAQKTEFNTSELARGVYYVTLMVGNRQYVEKLVLR